MNPLYDFKNQTQHSLYPTQNFVNSLQPYMNATYDFETLTQEHIYPSYDIAIFSQWSL